MHSVVHYILRFLLYGNESAIDKIAYTDTIDSNSPFPVTIVGNGIEGALHYPTSLAPDVEQLPNGHYVIRTDIIYNTFFFISRAEEVLNTKRDQYGRFLAQYSILSPNDLQIPLIDEYSRLVCKLLNLPLPESGFSSIYLTHDIDTLTQYRSLRGIIGGIYRGQAHQVIKSLRDIHHDPVYTFNWIIEQDAKCIKNAQCTMHNAQCTMHNAECIYFVKHTSGQGIDYPQYSLRGKDYRITSDMLLKSGAKMGIHSSAYLNYPLPEGKIHRSHYLCCSLERMQQLVDTGYTDDYSMGFADRAGFRLQTTRAVQWINPMTRQLTPLTLHPLTIMDCTLSNSNYMNLSEDQAYFYAQELIDKVRLHHGEINLLWHNSIFTDPYHTSLYPRILSLI